MFELFLELWIWAEATDVFKEDEVEEKEIVVWSGS